MKSNSNINYDSVINYKPTYESYKVHQIVFLDETLINGLKYLTRFSHRGSYDVDHSW